MPTMIRSLIISFQRPSYPGKVGHVEVDSDGIDTHLEVDADVFLGTLTVHSLSDTADKNNPWEVTIHLNGEPVLFKIDTEADVSVIPETVFKQLPGVSLKLPNRRLVGPGQN